MLSKLMVGAFALFVSAGCAHEKAGAQADPVRAIQRNIALPNQCTGSEVTYCAAHGSKAKDGLCQCLKQQDARSTLDNL